MEVVYCVEPRQVLVILFAMHSCAHLQPALSLSESLDVAAYRRRDGAEWSSSAGGVYEVTPTLVRAGLVRSLTRDASR